MKRKYDGKIDEKAYKKPRYNAPAREINKPVSDVRAIENAFYNPGSLSFGNLAQSLKNPINIATCDALLRQLTIYLKRNKRLPGDIKSSLSSLATIAFKNLEQVLNEASNPGSDFSTWIASQSQARRGQIIAFLIYNCGQIVEEKLDVPPFSANNLEILLPLLNKAKATSKSVANSLYGVGLLSKANKLRGVTDVSVVLALLNQLRILPGLNSQKVSNSLYGLGFWAQAGKLHGNLEASAVLALLTQLRILPDLNSQKVSNSLYGLGLLAQAGQLRGDIKASEILALLEQLRALPDLNNQAISNSLYGLGLLVKVGQLKGNIDALAVLTLLEQLRVLPDLNSQEVSSSLYGLGFLAQADKLRGNIDASVVLALLKKLRSLTDLKSQEISSSLYSLGFLAQAGKLHGDIGGSAVLALLKQLRILPDLNSQAISNSLYGLGLLAQAGKLAGHVDVSAVLTLLKQLRVLPDLKSQEVSNSLYGLGLLAQMRQLHGGIEASKILALLKQLPALSDLNTQVISNSLYGLGLLVKVGQLHGNIDASAVLTLLKKLLVLPGLKSQEVSNSLYGLGLLAQAGKFQGDIDAAEILALLKQLRALPDLKSQDVSNSLYGLGLLAQAGKFQGDIDAAEVLALLKRLPDWWNTQAISNSLYSLGLLAQAGTLRGAIDAHIVQSMLGKLMLLKNPLAIGVTQTLSGLSKLIPHLDSPRAVSTGIKELARVALDASYLHPTLAAEIVNSLVAFKEFADNESELLFREAVEALGIRLELFPPRIQAQLRSNITALVERPVWQLMLQQQLGLNPPAVEKLVAPTPQPLQALLQKPALTTIPRVPRLSASNHSVSFKKACSNKIFQAIAKRSENSLRQVLDLVGQALAAPARSRPSSAAPRTHEHAVRTGILLPQNSAEQLVISFLNHTHPQALRELISESQSLYFILLFQACSAHTRYQLAQSNAMHPIIINLPLAQLQSLLMRLQSPFQIYRDHQALLHLMDALTIRAEHNKPEQALLRQLQGDLLLQAITFHQKCHHHHVVRRLQLIPTLQKDNLVLLLDVMDEDDSQRTQPLSRNAISEPVNKPQPPLLLQEKSTAAREKSTGVNRLYQYETGDIQAILTARVHSYLAVHVMAAAQMNRTIPGNSIADVLNVFIRDQGALLTAGNQAHTLLLPIQLEGHWIGLAIGMQGNSIVSLTYFNSRKNIAEDNQHMATIKNQLLQQGLITEALNVSPAPRAMQQCDGSSCGALLIENFYCFLKNQWWQSNNENITPAMTQAMRQRHLDVLKQSRADYYPAFQTRQAKNVASVPSLTIQQQSHGLISRGLGFFPAVNKQQKQVTNSHTMALGQYF